MEEWWYMSGSGEKESEKRKFVKVILKETYYCFQEILLPWERWEAHYEAATEATKDFDGRL
jgi:hypothetical protein